MSSSATFPLSIISPALQVFSGQAAYVEVPGAEGDFGVLPHHAAFLSMIRPGVITVNADIGNKRFFVASGYADVSPAGVTILSERAVDLETVDAETLAAEIEAAQGALSVADTAAEKIKAEKELAVLQALRASLH